jgi:polysaccharide pyruvyl transferase WcaK-like protein
VPTIAYAVGAGPLTDAEDRVAVREVVSAMAHVSVRDEGSKRVLEEAGVTARMDVTADPALLMTPEPFPAELLAAEGVPVGARLIGMSVREPGLAASHLDTDAYHSLLAAVADFMVYRYHVHLLFIPMERSDVRHSHAVVAGMAAADRARVLNGVYSPAQILGLMQHLEFVVGMRLHVLLFAGISGVPFLPLPYAGKVADLARAAGLPLVTGVSRECIGQLLATLDEVWDTRQQKGLEVGARLGRLSVQAHRPLESVLACLAQPSTRVQQSA